MWAMSYQVPSSWLVSILVEDGDFANSGQFRQGIRTDLARTAFILGVLGRNEQEIGVSQVRLKKISDISRILCALVGLQT